MSQLQHFQFRNSPNFQASSVQSRNNALKVIGDRFLGQEWNWKMSLSARLKLPMIQARVYSYTWPELWILQGHLRGGYRLDSHLFHLPVEK